MKAKILCFICIVILSLSMSGCCYIINQALVTPTPVPSATIDAHSDRHAIGHSYVIHRHDHAKPRAKHVC